MSDDIRSILERLALVEGKTVPVSPKGSMTKQQERVPQLPALFKPKDISPTLAKKPYQKHPMDGYMVGETALAEAMQEVEEDMISKVKGRFADYLETLEKKNKIDQHLIRKAKAELNIDDDPETEGVDEDDATWDSDVAPISGPSDAADTEVAHGVEDQLAAKVSQPAAPVSESPVKTYTMEDGTCLECWGDDDRGYEIRHNGRSLPSKFNKVDHADMAVKIYQNRRRQALNQDYIEEK